MQHRGTTVLQDCTDIAWNNAQGGLAAIVKIQHSFLTGWIAEFKVHALKSLPAGADVLSAEWSASPIGCCRVRSCNSLAKSEDAQRPATSMETKSIHEPITEHR